VNIPIRFVTDVWREECQPGDAEFHDAKVEGALVKDAGITFRCPGCNHLGGVSFLPGGWKWDGNREAPTVTPSILHNKGVCGWHGYLTAGMFIAC